MTIPAPATALPWRISDFERDTGGDQRVLMGADNFGIAWLMGRSAHEHEQDAAYAVAACNSFPALVAALQEARETLEACLNDKAGDIRPGVSRTTALITSALSLALGEQ